jgi:N-acylneuraminate cytidylyltransferase
MKTFAFIFARGGSKGLPGKNILEFLNKPLIAHSIDFALQSDSIDEVIVSTDSPQIAEVAKSFGAKVPFIRPAELASDDSPEMLSWQHAVNFCLNEIGDFDRFISLPVVSPLRDHSDLHKIWSKLDGPEKPDFVISAKKSHANPYFNLFEKKESGFGICIPESSAYRRQDTKDVFQIIPMYYACLPEAVMNHKSLLEGIIELIEIPENRAADIDNAEDFEYLKFLASQK